MKLYKNVDIADIKSIMASGILPVSVTGNNNWNTGKRVQNTYDAVYLFSPTGNTNAFVQYGLILLEVEVDGAEKNEILSVDVNAGKYEEYTIPEVKPEQIKKIYAPAVFEEALAPELSGIAVTYVDMAAEVYGEEDLVEADQAVMDQFARTVTALSTSTFNYFRGLKANGEVMDVYNVRYEI